MQPVTSSTPTNFDGNVKVVKYHQALQLKKIKQTQAQQLVNRLNHIQLKQVQSERQLERIETQKGRILQVKDRQSLEQGNKNLRISKINQEIDQKRDMICQSRLFHRIRMQQIQNEKEQLAKKKNEQVRALKQQWRQENHLMQSRTLMFSQSRSRDQQRSIHQSEANFQVIRQLQQYRSMDKQFNVNMKSIAKLRDQIESLEQEEHDMLERIKQSRYMYQNTLEHLNEVKRSSPSALFEQYHSPQGSKQHMLKF